MRRALHKSVCRQGTSHGARCVRPIWQVGKFSLPPIYYATRRLFAAWQWPNIAQQAIVIPPEVGSYMRASQSVLPLFEDMVNSYDMTCSAD